VGAARAAIALDRLDDAKAHAADAAQLLSRWSGWRVDELTAVERRLGGGLPIDGPAELTPREREVVALLSEGLSNAELAARLYISPKTASVHVSNILAKLGMASRAEAAAYAVRAGLAPNPS
jgi:DNA-binding NarL/FixJ family response regulator